LSGTAAGLAALILVARHNTAKADFGDGIELDVITAVVLGGTSIFGGRGNILGTVLGVLLVHETREFVPWHWNKSEYNSIVIGMLLIGSVLLNRLLSVRRRGS
jgi:rhamnose transport system permease protein